MSRATWVLVALTAVLAFLVAFPASPTPTAAMSTPASIVSDGVAARWPCGTHTISFDPGPKNFDPRWALEQLYLATNVNFVEVPSGGNVHVSFAPKPEGATIGLTNTTAAFFNLGLLPSRNDITSAKVTLYTYDGASYDEVFLHELGHVAGLTHSNDPDSLMSPILSPSTRTFSVADRQSLAVLYADCLAVST